MKKREQEIFETIEKEVLDMGHEMTDAKRMEIEILVSAYCLWEQLREEVRKRGTTQVANSGYEQSAPWFTNMNKQHELIIKHSAALGFYKKEIKPKKDEDEDKDSLIN